VKSVSAGVPGRQICIFGGTFDPVHNAHLQIAAEAVRAFHLGQVLFVPAANPPHKTASQLTPFEDRFRMVELACQAQPSFSASRLEEGEGASYSIDTVERLKPSLEPGDALSFLIGSDAFDEIQTWHRWQDLVREVEFIVVSRPGAEFRIPPGARLRRLDGLALPVSSTDIRDRLARGEPTPELPPSVRAYIEGHGLYGAQPAPSVS
jgi:nicotinate-nucleotide adenylyltransferase